MPLAWARASMAGTKACQNSGFTWRAVSMRKPSMPIVGRSSRRRCRSSPRTTRGCSVNRSSRPEKSPSSRALAAKGRCRPGCGSRPGRSARPGPSPSPRPPGRRACRRSPAASAARSRRAVEALIDRLAVHAAVPAVGIVRAAAIGAVVLGAFAVAGSRRPCGWRRCPYRPSCLAHGRRRPGRAVAASSPKCGSTRVKSVIQ